MASGGDDGEHGPKAERTADQILAEMIAKRDATLARAATVWVPNLGSRPNQPDRFCTDPMRAIGGEAGILALSKTSGRCHMSEFTGSAQTAIDYNSTIIAALELSSKKWVLAVQLPGVDRHSRHVLDACGDGLVSFVARLKARCAAQVGRSLG